MPDFDTDPKMMREQQDKDTPEHLARDETLAHPGASDSDAASRDDRRKALRTGTGDSTAQMDAILDANHAEAGAGGTPSGEDEEAAEKSASHRAGLARSGRSRLDD
ncbi:hypothetical protein [Aurantimonas sp. VKM B-3413]|uniref:hypothetical protein n=1 Tax=Aurantimonas sp. VKM B-3413 TaxID=2779401 RepID=UPI001E5A0EF5|nr:hypothetical protein [Aurantimonas sp. VKM B-3413]MCB8840112.1 hypothetical protein [Aurantimonas sp. VKM B-3413]